jgi:hypothetical protein
MRVAFVLVAALLAARVCAAAEADTTGPDKPRPRQVYPKHERPIASPITDHFALRGSFFPASISTDVHLDSSNGVPGTALNAERDLGADSRLNQGRGELMFRLRERNRVTVDYVGSDRNASQVLDRDILVGGRTFHAADVTQSASKWARVWACTCSMPRRAPPTRRCNSVPTAPPTVYYRR